MRAVRRRGQAGQALAEFALTASILLVLLVGIAQLGLIYYALITVDSAAREGARVAAEQPGNTTVFSGSNSPSSPGSHACTTAPSEPNACGAAYNSTRNAFGGIIKETDLGVALVGSKFKGSSPVSCPQKTPAGGTSDGVVSVSVTYNVPIFVPLLGQVLASGNTGYRTVSSTVQTRVEPCVITNGN